MNKLVKVGFLVLAGTLLTLAIVSLLEGCGSGGLVTSANAAAECDTTSFTDRGGTKRVTIRCVETRIDTVYVPLEFEEFLRCVEEVLEDPPHGVPMEIAIRACIPAQEE